MRLIDADALAEVLGIAEDCQDCQYKNGVLCKKSSDFVDACEAIYDAPTIEAEWIPVSERLPEDEGWYLVTDDSGGVLWLEVEHYDPEFGLEPFCTIQNPVAWMPLPWPYKGGERDE